MQYDLVHAIHLLPKLEILYFENPVLESIPLYNYSLSHHGFRYSSIDRPLPLPSSSSTTLSFPSYTSLLSSPPCPSQRACERGIASIIKSYLNHSSPSPRKPPPISEISMLRGGDKKRRWYYDIGPGILSDSWGSVDGWIGFYCDRAAAATGKKAWKSAVKGPWKMENGGGESLGNLVEF